VEVEEPGLLDGLDVLPLAAGGGGILALLAAFLFYRRRKSGIPSLSSDPNTSNQLRDSTSTLGPNSVFQTAGGQSVDTSHTTPPSTDFSQAGPGVIDTNEVDPVAEADVYMAYGRDAQAEEILLDALQKDPQRTAIHSKLLEIYANRKSVKQFETLATELYAQTGGQGPEWDKIASLGRNLDPVNPLYGGPAAFAAAQVRPASFDADATLVAGGGSSQAQAQAQASRTPAAPALPEAEPSLDFVSGRPAVAAPAPAVADPLSSFPEEASAPLEAPGALDFDLDASGAMAPPAAQVPARDEARFVATVAQAGPADTGLDFDLSAAAQLDDTASTAAGLDFPSPVVNPEADLGSLDFDLEQGVGGPAAAGSTPAATPALDPLKFSSMETLVGDDFKAVFAQRPESAADAGASLLDFELTLPDAAAAPASAPEAAQDEASTRTVVMSMDPLEPDEDLEFDVQLTDSTILGNPAGGGFDLSGIDLDLGGEEPAVAAESAPAAAVPVTPATPVSSDAAVFSPRRDEVNTKLDLAKAYEEMGDLEGARELLTEVLGEGDSDQVEVARVALDRLSA